MTIGSMLIELKISGNFLITQLRPQNPSSFKSMCVTIIIWQPISSVFFYFSILDRSKLRHGIFLIGASLNVACRSIRYNIKNTQIKNLFLQYGQNLTSNYWKDTRIIFPDLKNLEKVVSFIILAIWVIYVNITNLFFLAIWPKFDLKSMK